MPEIGEGILGVDVNVNPKNAVLIPKDFDASPLDDALLERDDGGVWIPRVLPAAEYRRFSEKEIRFWCALRGFYGLPTKELVDYVADLIKGKRAIEVGSGCGVFARALGIPGTDSKVQNTLGDIYSAQRTIPVTYGTRVETLEASEAVKRYDPEVVVASWLSQRVTGFDRLNGIVGFAFGAEMWDILRGGRAFILIGNVNTHGGLKIMSKKPRVVKAPWLISRGEDQAKNRIWIWPGKVL